MFVCRLPTKDMTVVLFVRVQGDEPPRLIWKELITGDPGPPLQTRDMVGGVLTKEMCLMLTPDEQTPVY